MATTSKYMVHHYAYMTKVANVRELGSYIDAAKDANWHTIMEENETWDLVDSPKVVKSITTPTTPSTDTWFG